MEYAPTQAGLIIIQLLFVLLGIVNKMPLTCFRRQSKIINNLLWSFINIFSIQNHWVF